MVFELSVIIARPPADVFIFLRDKDSYVQRPGSPVLALDKTTPGPAGVGTRYREVVQMLPFIRGEILSEITRFEPDRYLEEDFSGAGMAGYLAYEFVPVDGGTLLIQRQAIHPRGALRLFTPLIRRAFGQQLMQRMDRIKRVLEESD